VRRPLRADALSTTATWWLRLTPTARHLRWALCGGSELTCIASYANGCGGCSTRKVRAVSASRLGGLISELRRRCDQRRSRGRQLARVSRRSCSFVACIFLPACTTQLLKLLVRLESGCGDSLEGAAAAARCVAQLPPAKALARIMATCLRSHCHSSAAQQDASLSSCILRSLWADAPPRRRRHARKSRGGSGRIDDGGASTQCWRCRSRSRVGPAHHSRTTHALIAERRGVQRALQRRSSTRSAPQLSAPLRGGLQRESRRRVSLAVHCTWQMPWHETEAVARPSRCLFQQERPSRRFSPR
jgi:hypothetical protein